MIWNLLSVTQNIVLEQNLLKLLQRKKQHLGNDNKYEHVKPQLDPKPETPTAQLEQQLNCLEF